MQLNGAGNMRTTGILYASEILRRFGDAFGAHVQQFPVPAFFDDPDTKQAIWRERSTRRVLDMQASMDVALFGLGSPFAEVPSHVYAGGYLERAATTRRSAATASSATSRPCSTAPTARTDGIALNERATGPDFDVLRRAPRRVCVVSGPVEAARASAGRSPPG